MYSTSLVIPDQEHKDWVVRMLTRPSNFCYYGDNEEMFYTWGNAITLEHRDSDIITRSNAVALRCALVSHDEWVDDWAVERASHFAVGWIDHLTFRVLDDAGMITPIAVFLKQWFERLEDYCVADEMLLSEMEDEEMQESWNQRNLKERISACVNAGLSMFAARNECYPSDDQGALREYLLGY